MQTALQPSQPREQKDKVASGEAHVHLTPRRLRRSRVTVATNDVHLDLNVRGGPFAVGLER